ncbi:MAG: heavy-metal-associated domain-containing protein [Ruminococcaceae bacterium]|jgi:copper chaperone CopZ|nr:heavy-metal-associated domain-containing protein [Oscillospiraceae bacterium]
MYKTELKIDGMMCGMCEAHINDTVRNNFEVKKVTSSHSKGISQIISVEPLDEEKLRKAIDETGYTVTGLTVEPYEKKGFFSFLK